MNWSRGIRRLYLVFVVLWLGTAIVGSGAFWLERVRSGYYDVSTKIDQIRSRKEITVYSFRSSGSEQVSDPESVSWANEQDVAELVNRKSALPLEILANAALVVLPPLVFLIAFKIVAWVIGGFRS